MKLHYKSLLALLCVLTVLTGSAQQASNPKPNLFNAFPSSIQCTEQELSRVFAVAEGQFISLSFSANFQFAGPVISNLQKYSNLRSTVIKSPTFNNAVFSLSKRTNADNSITYVGIIAHDDFGDGFMLKKNTDGSYQLEKFEAARKKPDCAHN